MNAPQPASVLPAAVEGRAQAVKPAEEAPRCCVICTDTSNPKKLIRPCRCCQSDYCKDCLAEMFEAASTDPSRMPPRCCSFLQIHTALDEVTHDEANKYRAKFEEWMTKDKVYCPAPACSAFIAPKLIPAPTQGPSLKGVLNEIITRLSNAPSARFFRNDMSKTMLPGYSLMVPDHIDLTIIIQRTEHYPSAAELTRDLRLMISNAETYHGPQHPVSCTAKQLFADYVEELTAATDKLVRLASDTKLPNHLLCPKCRIGICVRCHQTYHDGPCDTTSKDHEIAMLTQFGYKQCPLCKHATKKMYGCSHMMCPCGCHWCWGCAQPIDECAGTCGAEEDDFDEEDDYDSFDEDDEMADAPDVGPQAEATAAMAVIKPSTENDAAMTVAPPSLPTQPQPQQNVPERIRNLDAGGSRRWGETNLDFGEEPGDDVTVAVWFCHHSFAAYKVPEDGFNHGNHDLMECNRCFAHVAPLSRPGPKKKRKSITPVLVPEKDEMYATAKTAWECRMCKIVVCVGCRDKYVEEDKTKK